MDISVPVSPSGVSKTASLVYLYLEGEAWMVGQACQADHLREASPAGRLWGWVSCIETRSSQTEHPSEQEKASRPTFGSHIMPLLPHPIYPEDYSPVQSEKKGDKLFLFGVSVKKSSPPFEKNLIELTLVFLYVALPRELASLAFLLYSNSFCPAGDVAQQLPPIPEALGPTPTLQKPK